MEDGCSILFIWPRKNGRWVSFVLQMLEVLGRFGLLKSGVRTDRQTGTGRDGQGRGRVTPALAGEPGTCPAEHLPGTRKADADIEGRAISSG